MSITLADLVGLATAIYFVSIPWRLAVYAYAGWKHHRKVVEQHIADIARWNAHRDEHVRQGGRPDRYPFECPKKRGDVTRRQAVGIVVASFVPIVNTAMLLAAAWYAFNEWGDKPLIK